MRINDTARAALHVSRLGRMAVPGNGTFQVVCAVSMGVMAAVAILRALDIGRER